MTRLARSALMWRLLRGCVPSGARWAPLGLGRAAALTIFTPAFLLVQLIHWIGFLMDEILFSEYRQVQVREPLFVVGLPRSGTSRLQRALARDDRFTTMRLWELLLAPSVTERRAWLALARVDRAFGRPIGRILSRADRGGWAWMREVHPVSLVDPEEDYLLLLPAFACFLLVLPFPRHPDVWRLSQLDDWEEAERTALLDFYRSCLQRHLYVVGSEKRVLSKNPSLTSFARSLAEGFPDARFLCCVRDPLEAVPSQLSSVEKGMALFGAKVTDSLVSDAFVSMMQRYGRYVLEVSDAMPSGRWIFVPLPDLRNDLVGVIEHAYGHFGWSLPSPLRTALEAESETARAFESRHSYSLETFGLDAGELDERFEAFNERFGFGSGAIDTPVASRAAGPTSRGSRS